MKVKVYENRHLEITQELGTQNENNIEKMELEVPEKYQDWVKEIVFVTDDGTVWDLIENDIYIFKKNITKYEKIKFYIRLVKDEDDFRSVEEDLYFNENHEIEGEVTPEEQTDMERVISILESEITKTENLESQVDGKLEEIDTAIENINTAIQETENLDLDAEKVNKTTTVTITKKDGTEKNVSILDGADLQFIWRGTSLGIKTTDQEEYTFVNLQGVQGPAGPQGEPFTIKKTYTSIAEMNADFNNMQLGDYVMIATTVEVEDNAKLYTRGANQWIFITDFSGATGIRGETGLTPNIQIGTVTQGSSFSVTRTGTNENPILNFTLVKGDKGDKGEQGEQGDDYVLTQQDKQEIAELVDIPVDDVQINGTSIVQNGVANVPIASPNALGTVKIGRESGIFGIRMVGLPGYEGEICVNKADVSTSKAGRSEYKPITPYSQHAAAFYGLAKAAGDTTQSQSSNAVGTYTEEAKAKIQKMLGVSEEFELINVVSIDADAERIVCNVDMSGQQFSLKAAAVIIYVEPGSEQTGNANLTVGFSPTYNQFSSNFEQLLISAGIRITPQKNFGWAKVEGIIPEIRTDSIDGTSGYITMLECGTFATSEVKRCANETNSANANGYIQTVYVNGKTLGAGSFIRVWGIRA